MKKAAFDPDLTVPAAELASMAPKAWAEFRAAFRRYAEGRRDRLVQSSSEEILKLQGRAQECVQLVALFDDAVEAANHVSNAPAGKPRSHP